MAGQPSEVETPPITTQELHRLAQRREQMKQDAYHCSDVLEAGCSLYSLDVYPASQFQQSALGQEKTIDEGQSFSLFLRLQKDRGPHGA